MGTNICILQWRRILGYCAASEHGACLPFKMFVCRPHDPDFPDFKRFFYNIQICNDKSCFMEMWNLISVANSPTLLDYVWGLSTEATITTGSKTEAVATGENYIMKNLAIRILYLLPWESFKKGGYMGGTCNTHEGDEKCVNNFSPKMSKRRDQGVDRSIPLTFIFLVQDATFCT
jgi:hypothetical protein